MDAGDPGRAGAAATRGPTLHRVKQAVHYQAHFNHADDGDLEQISQQAMELAQRFAERPGVYRIFLNIGAYASVALRDVSIRHGRGVGAAQVDTTGPPSHTIDDVGTAMAFVIGLIESASTRPGAKRVWNSVLRDFASDLRGRQEQRGANT